MKKHLYKIIWDLIINKNEYRKEIKNFSDEDLMVVKKHLININRRISDCDPDYDRMWKGIKRRTNNKRRNTINNFLRYAASAVVILSVTVLSFYIYNNISNIESQNKYSKIEEYKGNSVNLILGGGEKIDLTKENTSNLIAKNSLLVKNEPNKLLTYIKKADTLIEPEYNTIEVPRAAEYSVRLSDGTIVYLNSESKLRYPVPFEKGKRKVYLEGEAYFKVSKDKNRPFIVNVKDVNVTVLGTSFNINAYKENNSVATTLVEGSVKVSSKNKSVVIKPNQQVVVSNEGKMSINNVDVYKYVSWRQGYLSFDNVPLEELMIVLERWFDINIFYLNQEIKDYRYTGAINKYYSLEKLLHIVEDVLRIKIRKKDKNVYIEKI